LITEITYNFLQNTPFEELINPAQHFTVDLTVIIILIVFIAFLFIISVIFALITMVLRLKNYLKGRKWSNLEDRWHDDLLAVISEAEEPSVLLDKVENEHKLYFLDYLFRFALRLKGPELHTLTEIAKPFEDTMVRRLSEGDTTQKVRAIITLDKLQLPVPKSDYIQLLDDPSPLVSLYAARAMIKQEYSDHEDVLEKIIFTLPRYENWSYRLLSNILAQAGSHNAHYLRNKLLDNNLEEKARIIIGESLILLNDIEAADTAARVLQNHPDDALAKTCLEIIANTGSPQHRKTVRPYLESSNPEIIGKSIEALGTIGNQEDIPAIEEAFNEQSNWIAFRAALALQQIKAEDVLQKISSNEGAKAQIALQVLQN